MFRRLENFAFHDRIAWWNLAISILITAILVGSIVSAVAFKIARKNPIDSLKYE
jgi:ABC-type antimicrobial peptide transport system permease subunit